MIEISNYIACSLWIGSATERWLHRLDPQDLNKLILNHVICIIALDTSISFSSSFFTLRWLALHYFCNFVNLKYNLRKLKRPEIMLIFQSYPSASVLWSWWRAAALFSILDFLPSGRQRHPGRSPKPWSLHQLFSKKEI